MNTRARVAFISSRMLVLLSGAGVFQFAAFGATEVFTSTTSWTCPANVVSVTVECWGGGGSGAKTGGGTNNGTGGGGGGYAEKTGIAVTPGENYYVEVGAGGYAITGGGSNGRDGGASYFSNVSLVRATGGGGGLGGLANNAVAGGAGGTGTAGDVLRTGGKGGSISSGTGRVTKGGGAAGDSQNGGDGDDTNGGIGGATGGGNGGGSGGGEAPGGGGGANTTGDSGAGGNGKVILTYQVTNFQPYERLVTFTDPTGAAPRAALLEGNDGSFYGTTESGGSFNKGTVFRMTPGGVLTTLVEFTDNGVTNKGSAPYAALVQGSDRNFYGTTHGGGALACGTIFKMTATGEVTTLVEFTGTGGDAKGNGPAASVVEGSDGNFYGTTEMGGALDGGTIFKMTSAGVLTTLVEFTNNGPSNKGWRPIHSLVEAGDGHLYGTTVGGGSDNCGTIFKVSPAGVLTTLVDFTSGGPSTPQTSLVKGNDGNFYGTCGLRSGWMFFRMTQTGVLTTLAEFTPSIGAYPPSGLTQGSDGNFYGTTQYNGIDDGGTIFRITTTGVLTTLVEFIGYTGISNNTNPNQPLAGVIQGRDGNLYGTTFAGGSDDRGTIFKRAPSPLGTLTVLAEFNVSGASDKASFPHAGLLEGTDGNFYGTTRQGGAAQCGTIFKMTPAGQLIVMVEFTWNGASNRGGFPEAELMQGSDGHFYGTTTEGGAHDLGTIFKMSTSGVLTTLVEFTGNGTSNKGSNPAAQLVQGSDGNLYGTTRTGGALNAGTIFKITAAGALTTLHEFDYTTGSDPTTPLIESSDGNFYGAAVSSYSGTIFRITPAGVLTTLFTFPYDNRTVGYGPRVLVRGMDGDFYGVTGGGGSFNAGTFFKITPTGTFTKLLEFVTFETSGWTINGLVQGADGDFYGSTRQAAGSIFKLSPLGAYTTIFAFEKSAIDGFPYGGLIFGSDGNLYGTTAGNSEYGSEPSDTGKGTVFRLLFPGLPNASVTDIDDGGEGTVVIHGKVNGRGDSATTYVEYGTDGIAFPYSALTTPSTNGYSTTSVSAILSGLDLGVTYYFRLRSTSSHGTTLSNVATLTTLGAPLATVTAATSVVPTSAQLNGTVNARNYEAIVVFQYGTDGNTFPNQVSAVPGTVTGSAAVPVSASVAGLVKGTTYYYRISATNAGGTTVSGVSSFTTLTDPVATVGPASFVTAQSAQLNGLVNAMGATTAVSFEYGTDGVSFLLSVGATPATVSGNTNTAVSAVLTGLSQGATYYYRVKGTSAGGVGVSGSASLTLDILSGFSRVVPAAPPAAQGFVFVTLIPSTIASGWRFAGEQQWRASGVPAGGLTTADRVIEYRPVPGYIQPLRETVSVISGGAATQVTREYYPTPGGATGGLSVTLKPDALTGAQWRLLGESDAQWRDTGATINGLAPGVYLVECKAVAGRTPPPPISVPVQALQTRVVTATYTLADASGGTAPSLLPFETMNGSPTLPYAFVGQLRSDVGSATGFVVKARVVATAGHVVFDDGALSYVTGLQWLFQRDSGSFEPKPQIPRGFYLFDGYAMQRTNEGTPGVSTPQSQSLDAAAIYFIEDAGRGGYGGYLASDLDNNEFLLSPKLKLLVGYPVDGVPTLNQGRMHATPASNVTFAAAFGHTYTTTNIRSSGGNSGGPLCVQTDSGTYYPAAIYLGGSAQTVVRAIDSQVIDLFNRAEVSGNGGSNNTGGGITQVDTPISGDAFAAAALKVDLLPAAAVASGAGWKLSATAEAWASGEQRNNLSAGNYTLYFTPATGFLTPPPATITLTGGELSTVTQTYLSVTSAAFDSWRTESFTPEELANPLLSGPTADFDADGITNLMEYALNLNPKLNEYVTMVAGTGTRGLPLLGIVNIASQSFLTAEYVRRTANSTPGITYSLEFSSDLSNASGWSVVGAETVTLIDATWERVKVTDPLAVSPTRFVRLRIAQP